MTRDYLLITPYCLWFIDLKFWECCHILESEKMITRVGPSDNTTKFSLTKRCCFYDKTKKALCLMGTWWLEQIVCQLVSKNCVFDGSVWRWGWKVRLFYECPLLATSWPVTSYLSNYSIKSLFYSVVLSSYICNLSNYY